MVHVWQQTVSLPEGIHNKFHTSSPWLRVAPSTTTQPQEVPRSHGVSPPTSSAMPKKPPAKSHTWMRISETHLLSGESSHFTGKTPWKNKVDHHVYRSKWATACKACCVTKAYTRRFDQLYRLRPFPAVNQLEDFFEPTCNLPHNRMVRSA